MPGVRYGRTVFIIVLFLTGCFQQPELGPPPNGAGVTPREAAYNRLSPRDRGRVDDGELVFTGVGFVVPPPMLERPVRPGYGGHAPLDHMSDWLCPLEADPQAEDRGTFFLYGTYNGDNSQAGRELNYVSASFVLPPPGNISVGSWESPYAMLGGWAPLGSNTSFDAGFGWQDPAGSTSPSSGWFFHTNRFFAGVSNMRARKYRLLNVDSDTSPVTVDLSVFIDSNDHLLATATATGSTRWVSPHIADDSSTPGNEAILTDPATGQAVLTLTLGGSDEGLDENTGDGPLPVQYVPGFAHNGHDNVFSFQVDLATPRSTDPIMGSYVLGIGTYALQAGYLEALDRVPSTNAWDIYQDDVTLFQAMCPEPNWENAYDVHGGNTASATAAAAFMIDIDIAEEDIHGVSHGVGNIAEPTTTLSGAATDQAAERQNR